MSDDNATAEMVDDQLNSLYWTSAQTIDEILDEVGVARSTLYTSIAPLPTGFNCPACGDQLVYTNRTHRAARTASCPACGAEQDMAGAESDGRHASAFEAGGRRPDDEGRWDRWRDEIGMVPRERAALIGGAAALGLIVGAAAARAFAE